MQKFLLAFGVCAIAVLGAQTAQASTVSEREYKRGYNDCLRGEYDQDRHGASYKRGCRAAEDSGKTTGHEVKEKANGEQMRQTCYGAAVGRFSPHASSVKLDRNPVHENSGWSVYGNVILDDGAQADVVCMFSSTGKLKRLNAGQPVGGSAELDNEGYCPPDVSEADRYRYPGCD
ncbi:MAG TPA: hypothetical protein PKE65_02590 [Rhizobiaceae bacterium]|nr:hypothetical protein [Rhizobiaceae bacterium]